VECVGSAGKKKVKHLGNIDKLHKQNRNPGAFLTTTLWRLRPALGGMDGDLKEKKRKYLFNLYARLAYASLTCFRNHRGWAAREPPCP